MFTEDIARMIESGQKKIRYMRESPSAYLLLSALAGVYVGFGIVLIFAVGGPIQAAGSPYLKLIMGASFGVALSLVVFAGCELFTGNNMVFAVGHLNRTVGIGPITRLFLLCYIGNFLGSAFLSWLVVIGGSLSPASASLILQASAMKMSVGGMELFVRGILCNWLVCLAVWTSGRTRSDAAKLILIFWCLFAFISSGFEHCVANMTLLTLGLFLPHDAGVSLGGLLHNLFWVTGGNILGGGMFVGMFYWLAARAETSKNAAEELPDAREIPGLAPQTTLAAETIQATARSL